MSDIKIFANSAKVATTTDGENLTFSEAEAPTLNDGIVNDGIVIADESTINRTEFNTGFIPYKGSSSVTLNTILRQCSTMAKILADVCQQTEGVKTSPTSTPASNADTVTQKLSSLLTKLNQLVVGGTKAHTATEADNYTKDGTIYSEYEDIQKQINDILNGISAVDCAMYAYGDTSSTINSRINNLSVRINSLIKSNPVEVTSSFGTVGSSRVIKSGNLVLIRNLVINKGSAITGSSSYQTIAKLKNITISNADNGMICQSTGVGIFGSSGGGTFSFDAMLSSDGSDVIVSCKFPNSGTLTSVTLQHIGFEIKNIVE